MFSLAFKTGSNLNCKSIYIFPMKFNKRLFSFNASSKHLYYSKLDSFVKINKLDDHKSKYSHVEKEDEGRPLIFDKKANVHI